RPSRRGGRPRCRDSPVPRRRADGSTLKRVTFSARTLRSLVTLRPALHGTLLDAVGPQALVLGREARGFTLTSTGAAVVLADGTAVHGDIVVGADGVGSVIRAGLHP